MKRLSFTLFIVTMTATGAFWAQCASMEMESARVYLSQNNLEEAEVWGLKAVEKEPANPEPSYWLGINVYSKQGNWEKMIEMFEKSLSISDKFATDIDRTREKHWIDRFNAGARALNSIIDGQATDIEAARAITIKEFKLAIVLRPEKVSAYSSLASTYLQGGDLVNARSYMEQALELDDRDVATLANLGIMLSKDKQYEDAVDYLERALELEPTNVNAIQQLAQNYDLMGREEDAEKAYSLAIEASPENSTLYYNLGVLHLRREEFVQAESYFIQSLELSPDDCDAISNVAVTYSNMDDKLAEAESFLLRATECDSADYTYWRSLVGVYMKMGQPEKAKEALSNAKELGYGQK